MSYINASNTITIAMSSGSGTTSASSSPGPSCCASPNIDTNVGVHGVGVHSVGAAGTSRSELMGALGGDNVVSGYGSISNLNMPMNMSSMSLGGGAGNGITLGGIHIGGVLGHAYAGTFGHHAYPGSYHPDYLSSQFHLDATLPFLGVDRMDGEESPGATATGGGAGGGKEGEGNGEADADEHRSSKCCCMSTDSAGEPPSSAVSCSSYAESMTSASTAPTSAISGHSKPGFETTWPCAFAVDVRAGSSSGASNVGGYAPVSGPGTEFFRVTLTRAWSWTFPISFFAPAVVFVGKCTCHPLQQHMDCHPLACLGLTRTTFLHILRKQPHITFSRLTMRSLLTHGDQAWISHFSLLMSPQPFHSSAGVVAG
ncbi:hypothetical protein BKA82DRAFT_962707 [Pisolithus tinctorius]|uniref:Uncharacterized protein n=1 Tax=Pisolithus tinctorius Marx 270 TaxID=870435 RepID=A0A0C3JTF1_PISTI|nr:hypothetical protein BKA82DRAFT_962707 [Pisolithus tinctorius]KIO00767.1 hypothetical protein M404DRAFT_962707 [Pisolithus tinctorius Marx 270]